MIGVDTNVLARAILLDDPVATPLAQRFLTATITAKDPGYINLVTLVELIWTLKKTGRLSRDRLVAVITGLLAAENIVLERPDLVARALKSFEKGGAGFADYLIAELNQTAGAIHTVTLDQKASHHPHFMALN